jgi:hypothetical protein
MVARVGVVPPTAFHARRRLLGALSQALGVRFEARPPGSVAGLDAVIRIGMRLPPPRLPCLDALADEREPDATAARVRLAAGAGLDSRLAGAVVIDGPAAVAQPLRPGPDAVIRATRGPEPLWVRCDGHEEVAVAPLELGVGEALRSRMMSGRCLALLALVHFLREVRADQRPTPPLRAAFVIDDPNLHWPSYGHVHFGALACDAQRHGYHVAMATVPLDGWFTHPRVRRLFHDHPAQLSLLIHGRLHYGPELGQLDDVGEATRCAQDALRRVAALERRTGLTLRRVMVPPHERLSPAAAAGLLAAGFEAVTMSRPHPWLGGDWLSAPPGAGPLVGWQTTDRIAGGLPVLLRNAFSHPRDDLVLRAFLDQPLILYGHQDDLAGGLDVLRDAAAQINALGAVRWGSPADLVRTSGPAPAGIEGTWRAGARPILRRLASEGRDRLAPLLAVGTRTIRRPRARSTASYQSGPAT